MSNVINDWSSAMGMNSGQQINGPDPNQYKYSGSQGGLAAQQQYYQQQSQTALGRQGAQVNNQYGTRDQANVQGVLGGYGGLANYYQQQLSGQGLSLAAQQMKAATDQNIAAQMAMANSAHGGLAAAAAQRQAAISGVNMAQSAAQQSMMGRIQEEQNAAQGMGGLLASQGQLALGAQAANQQAAYQQAALQQQQNAINAQSSMGYEQLGQQASLAQLQANEAQQNAALTAQGQGLQQGEFNAQQNTQMVSGLVGAAAGAMVAADLDLEGSRRPHLAHAHYADADMGGGFYDPTMMAVSMPGAPSAGEVASAQSSLAQAQQQQQRQRAGEGQMLASLMSMGGHGGQVPAIPMPGQYADADLEEPGGPAHWTLREEPRFILAKNQMTGDLRKLVTAPLTDAEFKQAMKRHGAGPLGANDPRRIRTVANDLQMGASPMAARTAMPMRPPSAGFGSAPMRPPMGGSPSVPMRAPMSAGMAVRPMAAGGAAPSGYAGGGYYPSSGASYGPGYGAQPQPRQVAAPMMGAGLRQAYADLDLARSRGHQYPAAHRGGR